jgi:hypothetical protein
MLDEAVGRDMSTSTSYQTQTRRQWPPLATQRSYDAFSGCLESCCRPCCAMLDLDKQERGLPHSLAPIDITRVCDSISNLPGSLGVTEPRCKASAVLPDTYKPTKPSPVQGCFAIQATHIKQYSLQKWRRTLNLLLAGKESRRGTSKRRAN